MDCNRAFIGPIQKRTISQSDWIITSLATGVWFAKMAEQNIDALNEVRATANNSFAVRAALCLFSDDIVEEI